MRTIKNFRKKAVIYLFVFSICYYILGSNKPLSSYLTQSYLKVFKEIRFYISLLIVVLSFSYTARLHNGIRDGIVMVNNLRHMDLLLIRGVRFFPLLTCVLVPFKYYLRDMLSNSKVLIYFLSGYVLLLVVFSNHEAERIYLKLFDKIMDLKNNHERSDRLNKTYKIVCLISVTVLIGFLESFAYRMKDKTLFSIAKEVKLVILTVAYCYGALVVDAEDIITGFKLNSTIIESWNSIFSCVVYPLWLFFSPEWLILVFKSAYYVSKNLK